MDSGSPIDLDLLVTKALLVIRKSAKFTPSGFLQSLLGPVVSGLASLNPIAGDLGMRIARRIGGEVGRARLSYEKLYDLLTVHLVKAADLSAVAAFDPDPRHVTRDKRARQSPVESDIPALA